MPEKQLTAEEILLKRAENFKKAFRCPEGEDVLKALREEYKDIPLFESDQLRMAGRVACHDMVLWIERQIAKGENPEAFVKPKVNVVARQKFPEEKDV